MGSRTKLANLQYNSPIRIYSDASISEAIKKHSEVLSTGVVGIDFHKRPASLANSEVLKMVEQQDYHVQGLKRVAWPPPPEEQQANQREEENQPPAPHENFQQANLSQPYQQPSQQPIYQHQPLQRLPTPYQHQQQSKFGPGIKPVPFEPPKTTVTLLREPPIRQETAPVYASQPVTSIAMGGNRMRGDDKWPPENVRQQAEAENAARIALARGPVFRPKRPNKDYRSFFAQNALNSTYPGYRAPPGTQHYIEEGTSNL